MKEEIWKSVEGFENYMVSNWGRVKSLKWGKEKMLKPGKDSNGYLQVILYKDGKTKSFKVHKLVWDAFGDRPRNGHTLQVDHINNDKTYNRIENLQLLNNRENTSKMQLTRIHTSKYIGVSWNKRDNKWEARIGINGKNKFLGYFQYELEAAKAYQNALKNINNDKS